MIVCFQDPEDPDRRVFFALYMNRKPVWTPVKDVTLYLDQKPVFVKGGKQEFPNALEAGRACASTLAARYQEIVSRARILRLMCEHPEFDFCRESIDADMFREQAQELEERVCAEKDNVDRLLDEPNATDIIRVSGVRMEVTHDGLLIPSQKVSDEDVESDDRPLWLRSEKGFAQIVVNVVVGMFQEFTGHSVSATLVEGLVEQTTRMLNEEGRPKVNQDTFGEAHDSVERIQGVESDSGYSGEDDGVESEQNRESPLAVDDSDAGIIGPQEHHDKSGDPGEGGMP